HSIVRMQGFLKAQRCSPCIRYLKLEAQLSTERGTVDQTKFGGPPSLRTLVAFGEHAHSDRTSGLCYRLKLPRLRAYEAVCRRGGIVRLASKPGETDWYASTNRAAVLPSRLGAEKKHFLPARWLPGGDVRAVQIHLPCNFGRGD